MRLWCSLGLLALAGCQSKVVDIKVNIITTACQPPAPLEEVTHLWARVTGDGMTPIEATAQISVADRQVKLPDIPAGPGRVIEVRGYAGEPKGGGKVKSLGKSLPFTVPEEVPLKPDALEVHVFLRRVGAFVPPSSVIARNVCSRMLTPRAGHTATLLKNGKVLILGGYQYRTGTERTTLADAEFFNPATGAFEDAPKMGIGNNQHNFTPLPRAFQTATLLPNGQVLIWGGEEYVAGNQNGNNMLPRAGVFVFDPDYNWYLGVPMSNLPNIRRTRHAAALEKTGKVLIVGGHTLNDQNQMTLADSVEWFDPSTTRAAKIDALAFTRTEMAVAPVQDGAYIAVAGGIDATSVKSEVSFFSFNGTTFSLVTTAQTPRLREGRRGAGAVAFRQGNDLLLLGGYSDRLLPRPLASTEIISTKDSFQVADGPSVTGRGDICAALLGDGRVLAVGGRLQDTGAPSPRSDGTVEVVFPQANGTVTSLGRDPLRVPRYAHTCTTLADGSVLVLGGVKEVNGGFEVLQDALIYTPEPYEPDGSQPQ